MTKESPTTKKVLRIGHRGAAGHAPENTLRSIEQAIALGCDLVEVDVRRTRGGDLVLLHDERVDRTTNGRGTVARMVLRNLRKLDAGSGEHIPTLEEALRAANGRIGLILELKAEGIDRQTCAVVRHSAFTGQIIYASFKHEALLRVRHAEPTAMTMALFKRLPKDPVSAAMSVHATHVGLRHDAVTKPLVKALHEAGLRVLAFTVNEPADIREVRSFGVDGIISDYPDRI